MAEPVLKLGRWNGTAIDAGEIWRLRNASRVASCHLWTHPKGGEVRWGPDSFGERAYSRPSAVPHSYANLEGCSGMGGLAEFFRDRMNDVVSPGVSPGKAIATTNRNTSAPLGRLYTAMSRGSEMKTAIRTRAYPLTNRAYANRPS